MYDILRREPRLLVSKTFDHLSQIYSIQINSNGSMISIQGSDAVHDTKDSKLFIFNVSNNSIQEYICPDEVYILSFDSLLI